MPKRCQETMQIKIDHVNQRNYADFSHKKHRKYVEKRYSDNVKVDVLLDQAVLLLSSSNL